MNWWKWLEFFTDDNGKLSKTALMSYAVVGTLCYTLLDDPSESIALIAAGLALGIVGVKGGADAVVNRAAINADKEVEIAKSTNT